MLGQNEIDEWYDRTGHLRDQLRTIIVEHHMSTVEKAIFRHADKDITELARRFMNNDPLTEEEVEQLTKAIMPETYESMASMTP